jgi:hypothetical protein
MREVLCLSQNLGHFQRSICVPDHVQDYLAIIGQSIDINDKEYTNWLLARDIIDVTAFLARLINTSPEAAVQKALELDIRLEQRIYKVPPAEWRYETIYTAEGELPNLVWNRRYYQYPNYSVLCYWSGIYACRIQLHEIIRGQLQLSSHPDPEQLAASARILKQMQEEILASVPLAIAGSPAAKASRNGDPNGLILWLMYLVCVMDQTTAEVRTWVVQRLKSIAEEVGMRQANTLALYIEGMGFPNEGETKPFGSRHYGLEGTSNSDLKPMILW